MHSTRVMGEGKSRGYVHEMSDEQHSQLLDALLELEGMVIVCGYPNELYSSRLAGWAMHTTKARISAGRGTALRDECLWLNPAAVAGSARQGYGLFTAKESAA
jgi:DNA adenine methylase